MVERGWKLLLLLLLLLLPPLLLLPAEFLPSKTDSNQLQHKLKSCGSYINAVASVQVGAIIQPLVGGGR